MRCALLFALVLSSCARQERAAPWLTSLTRAQHDRFFPVAAGVHLVDCNQCHGTSDSFTGFDCTTCHTQPATAPRHPAVDGFRFSSPSCYACHPRGVGTLSPALHAASFPIDVGQSHALGSFVAGNRSFGCGSCHVDLLTPGNVDCTGCHLQTSATPAGPGVPADQVAAHAGKVGITGANGAVDNLWLGTGAVGTGGGASAKCLLCHAADMRQGGFVATHGAAGPAKVVFTIGASNSAHLVSCDQCHTGTLGSSARKNPAADFANASCDACHLTSGPNSVAAAHTGFGVAVGSYTAGDPNNSSACLACHPNGERATNFSHLWFPIGVADVHNAAVAKCATCHADPTTYQGSPAANVARIACTSCHNDSAANLNFQKGFSITAVHSAARVGKDIWSVPSGMDYASNALCLKCHAGNIGGTVAGFSTPLVFRLAQHDNHCSLRGKNLTGGDPAHWVDNKSDITGVNLCFACHNATTGAGATPWAADWPKGPTASCTACHKHTIDPAPTVICQ